MVRIVKKTTRKSLGIDATGGQMLPHPPKITPRLSRAIALQEPAGRPLDVLIASNRPPFRAANP